MGGHRGRSVATFIDGKPDLHHSDEAGSGKPDAAPEVRSGVAGTCTSLKMPPFPQVALKVLQLVGNENVQMSELGDLIASDPAFATEVLTIANSLLYAPRYPIRSIRMAIDILGATHLQGICLTVGVRTYMGKWLGHPVMRTIWRHNMACALIAEQIAAAGSTDRNIAFTSGVMHGIGLLALAVMHPKEYIHLLGTHIGTPESLMGQERALFGFDHGELGRALVEQWNLPEDFAAVVAGPGRYPAAEAGWDVVQIIDLSCAIADSAGYAAFPACHPIAFEALLDRLPARERRLFHTDVETLGFELSKKIAAVEGV